MKRNSTLYNLIMNIIAAVVGTFLFYRLAVHLNPKNDYHVNGDVKYFLVIWGIICIFLRYLLVDIFDMFKTDGRTIEDEIREHITNDTNRLIEETKEKKDINNFKFLSK